MIKKIKAIMKKLLNKSSIGPVTYDMEQEFVDIYNKCSPYTMTSVERMYSLYQAAKYVCDAGIKGDLVECGVWKGGSAMLMVYTLLSKGIRDRKIYLYDTYAGMTMPTEHDYHLHNKIGVLDNWKKRQRVGYNEWSYAPFDEVKKNLASTGYPEENILMIKGTVEETIPRSIPKSISLLRLDTDWYESTKHEMDYLFPLVTQNGVLIVDDYGCFAGAKKAIDEYISGNSVKILLNRIDYTGRLGIKQ